MVIALDRDRAGKEMAEMISAQLPKAVVKTPKAKDWNQDLVNSFDWSSKNRSNEMKQEREIDRGGGLSW